MPASATWIVLSLLLSFGPVATHAREAAQANTTTLDSAGNATITRTVPAPAAVSAEARALLTTGLPWCPSPGTEEHSRLVARALEAYPVATADSTIGGVAVRVFRRVSTAPADTSRLLMNLHGGGFVEDSGSMLESIPMAALTGIPVVSVLYRLAPEHVYPAAVEDVVAVYRALLSTVVPEGIAVFGTSAGAVLAAQSVVRFRHLGLPPPAAVGFFSGSADLGRLGDSGALYGIAGLADAQVPQADDGPDPLLGGASPTDPLVSPIYADLSGFPPTLCVTGTRDILLSDTATFHRALVRRGVDAQLVVFEAMPHAHWYTVDVPESREALDLMSRFFLHHLGAGTE